MMIRILLVCLILSGILAASVTHTDVHKQHQIDPKLLRLSLKVMLYNNDLPHALILAKKGAKRFSHDPWWLKKAADISLWTSHPDLAKKYYLSLYKIDPKGTLAEDLKRLAIATYDTSLTIKLLEDQVKNGDRKTIPSLLDAYNYEGSLERGATFFAKLYAKHPSKALLKAEIKLKMDYDTFPHIQRRYRYFLKKYGHDTELTYDYAKMLFARKEFEKAFDSLDTLTAKVPKTKQEFWKFYIDLAFLLHKEKRLYPVLKTRFAQKLLAKEDYDKLLFIARNKEPDFAVKAAQQAWIQFPTSHSFFTLVALAQQSKKPDIIASALKHIPSELSKVLEQNPRYWLIQASVHENRKEIAKTQKAYLKAASLAPDSADIQSTLLWSLIDHQQLRLLKHRLFLLSRTADHAPALQMPFAAGYMLLQNTQEAKRHLKKVLYHNPKDWQLRLFYADLLQIWQDKRGALKQMRYAWKLAKKEAKKTAMFKHNSARLNDFLRLALYFNPLKRKTYLKIAQKHLPQKQFTELYLGTLVNQSASKKVQYLSQHYQIHHPWLELYLALANDNRDQMYKIVSKEKERLPIADRVTAAQKSGMVRLSETMLFSGLEQNPRNQDLSTLFADTLTKKDPVFSWGGKHVDRGTLSYSQIDFEGTTQFPMGIQSMLHFSQKSAIKTEALRTPAPSTDSSLTLAFKKRISAWDSDFSISMRKRIHYEYGVKAHIGYRTKYTTLKATMGKAQPDDTTNTLLLFGKKDLLALDATYQPSPTDTLSASLHGYRYHERTKYQGDAYGGGLDYTKRLRFGYPQIRAHTFIQWENFTHKSTLLPQSYWQIGTGFGLGEEDKNSFHRSWRPYGSVDLLYHNHNGIGYTILTGISGMANHQDKLNAELFYSSGTGRIQEKLFSARVRYILW